MVQSAKDHVNFPTRPCPLEPRFNPDQVPSDGRLLWLVETDIGERTDRDPPMQPGDYHLQVGTVFNPASAAAFR